MAKSISNDDRSAIIQKLLSDRPFVSQHRLTEVGSMNVASLLVKVAMIFFAYFRSQGLFVAIKLRFLFIMMILALIVDDSQTKRKNWVGLLCRCRVVRLISLLLQSSH